MKKVVSLLLVFALVLGSASLIACGPKGATKPPSTEKTTTTTQGTQTTTTGGGFTWNDMPVYSGANQLQKVTWSIPPAQGEWSRAEWRYYETSGSVSAVAAFYRAEMVKANRGWQEKAWMEAGQIQWGYFVKNNEQDGAMVWIGLGGDKTGLALMRASK